MKRILLVFPLACLLIACSSRPGAVNSAATQSPVAQPVLATSTAAQPVAEPHAAGWVQYRDARYGYGLALPCYWVITPTPAEGSFAVMSARSFTDEFRAAHSERGVWTNDTWPAGAMKLDVLMVEDLDPALNLPDTVRHFYTLYAGGQEIRTIEDIPLGRGSAVRVTVSDGLQGEETLRIIYVLLRPGTLLSLIFVPGAAFDSPDAQAILNSISLVKDQPVAYPSVEPAGPPDGGPIACP
jgi:hypothetical protein